VAFFILPPLARVGRTRADDSDDLLLILLSVYHDEQALAMRDAHDHPTLLVVRVVRVGDRDRQRVGKYSARFVETDPVPLLVAPRFAWIPLEPDGHFRMEALRK
jgi:hypothetical protein